MKNFFSYLLISFISFTNIFYFTINTTSANNCFVVTAYYSPLPNQKYFFKWDYEAEIILNGRWITWASWKPVFSWMIAAPKKYPFWTKIYLEWVWIWEVADRWWAIVSTDLHETRWYEYDRIDIWMWYWEEWLSRALTWWKRTVCNSYIIEDSNTQTSINIKNIPAPYGVLTKLKKAPINIFAINIWVKSDIEETKKLHNFLTDLWYYKWDINSKYNKQTVVAIYKFQFDNKIVNSTKNNWAWLWWEQTRTLAEKINNQKNKVEIQLVKIKQNIEVKVVQHIEKIWNPKVWDIWENVRILQKTLKTLWYFKVQDNAIFWQITTNSLITYQIDRWILSSKDDYWAWYFWPKTKENLKNDLIKILEEQVLKEKNLLVYKK